MKKATKPKSSSLSATSSRSDFLARALSARPGAKRPRVIGIVRVSTRGQAKDECGGVPGQHAAIKRIVGYRDLDLIETIELAGVSGTEVAYNPEFQRVLEQIQTGKADGVVVAEASRFMRPSSIDDLLLLRAFEQSAAKIYDGRDVIDFSNFEGTSDAVETFMDCGRELRMIAERMRRGKEALRHLGRHPGPQHTLARGVHFDRATGKFSYTSAVIPVKEAFRLVDEKGIRNIAKVARLVKMQRRTVDKLLRNTIYMGVQTYGTVGGPKVRSKKSGKLYRKKVARAEEDVIQIKVIDKPAVTAKRWHRVQRILEQASNSWSQARRQFQPVNLLGGGLAKCSRCGTGFYCAHDHRKARNPGYYYCASNHYLKKRATGTGCKQGHIRKDVAHELVWNFAIDVLSRPETVEDLLASVWADQTSKEAAEEIVAQPNAQEIHQKIARLVDAFQEGIINKQTLSERKQALEALIPKALPRAKKRQAQSAPDFASFAEHVMRCTRALRRVKNDQEKREYLEQIFQEIVIQDQSVIGFKLSENLLNTATQAVCESGTPLPPGTSRTSSGARPMPPPSRNTSTRFPVPSSTASISTSRSPPSNTNNS